MPKTPDLIGQKFERLTVIEKTSKRKNGAVVWLCKCDCGKYKEVTTADLRSGRVRSCGCYNHDVHAAIFHDLTGQRFGRLTVIKKTDKRTANRNIIWECKCDCGKICEVSSDNLIRGQTRSCGCLQKETIAKIGRDSRQNLIGKRFGKLIVLSHVDNAIENTWHCKCDCGNECDVKAKYLLNGHKSSCGCGIKSKGEQTIIDLLQKNNIPFKTQYHFADCIFPDTNYFAYFDFYVNNQYIIEYDGEQHFSNQCFNGISKQKSEDEFIKTQQHDLFKNQYCFSHSIPIIRIPYTQLKTLSINDLKIDTSTFILQENK